MLACLALAAGCEDDPTFASAPLPDGPPAPDAATEVPAVTTPEEGLLREVLRVEGTTPPPHPGGMATPEELNATQLVRYRREDGDPPRAVVVIMPGLFGGAGSLDPLARAVVQRGAREGLPLEVWAIDRRANLLEDLTGMDAAEAGEDADIASAYYFGEGAVGDRTFAGHPEPADLAFMSEWGARTHVEDLRRVIARVPAGARRGHVFLAGHSLGGLFTQAYAAWRFEDGTRGAEELAGAILIDSATRDENISEAEYHDGLSGFVGVDAIRADTPAFEIPFIGTRGLLAAEIGSLRTIFDPMGVVRDDPPRDSGLAFFLGLTSSELPAMTNRAALGFAFDYWSDPIDIIVATLGAPTGGPLGMRPSLGARMLRYPSDPAATYDWESSAGDAATGFTPLDAFAHAFFDGRTNMVEWYFPSRISIDLAACGDGQVAEGSWQAREGLTAMDAARNDVPILAVAAGLGIATAASYAPLRDRLAPLGADRPAGALPRSDPRAFRVLEAPGMTHLDVTLAPDGPDNPIPAAIIEHVRAHVADGALPTITLP